MTLFRAAQAAAAVVIDSVFGEQFTLQPMAHVGGRYSPDVSRSSQTITGILMERSGFTDPIGERNASGMSKGLVSQNGASQATIEIPLGAVPYAVKGKDRLTRLATGEIWEVSGSPSTDLDHIVLRVSKLGAPA